MLGKESNQVYADMQQSLSYLGDANAKTNDRSVLLTEALKVGANNLNVLALLEDAHVSKFGNPVPASVETTPIAGKV